MDRNLRDRFQGQPVYERTLEFCEKYDAPAFDPDYDTLPLSFFEPMVRRLMSSPKNTIYTSC
jgi:predicted HD phosphohydrolase